MKKKKINTSTIKCLGGKVLGGIERIGEAPPEDGAVDARTIS